MSGRARAPGSNEPRSGSPRSRRQSVGQRHQAAVPVRHTVSLYTVDAWSRQACSGWRREKVARLSGCGRQGMGNATMDHLLHLGQLVEMRSHQPYSTQAIQARGLGRALADRTGGHWKKLCVTQAGGEPACGERKRALVPADQASAGTGQLCAVGTVGVAGVRGRGGAQLLQPSMACPGLQQQMVPPCKRIGSWGGLSAACASPAHARDLTPRRPAGGSPPHAPGSATGVGCRSPNSRWPPPHTAGTSLGASAQPRAGQSPYSARG